MIFDKYSCERIGLDVSPEGGMIPPRGTLYQTKNSLAGVWCILVSAEGLEPSTNGLKGRCSTIELRAQERMNSITALNQRQ